MIVYLDLPRAGACEFVSYQAIRQVDAVRANRITEQGCAIGRLAHRNLGVIGIHWIAKIEEVKERMSVAGFYVSQGIIH